MKAKQHNYHGEKRRVYFSATSTGTTPEPEGMYHVTSVTLTEQLTETLVWSDPGMSPGSNVGQVQCLLSTPAYSVPVVLIHYNSISAVTERSNFGEQHIS